MMKQSLSRVILYSIAAVAFLWIGVTSTSAGEVREADKLVHKALKERTKTFCRSVLPAWFKQKNGQKAEALRTLVADCYLGHARLAILGIYDKPFLKDIGLSELPSALLVRETGMSLDVYRPLAGRTIKDYLEGK